MAVLSAPHAARRRALPRLLPGLALACAVAAAATALGQVVQLPLGAIATQGVRSLPIIAVTLGRRLFVLHTPAG